MPELPEVETVRRTLLPILKGKVIRNVDVYYGKTIDNVTEEEFINKLKDEKVLDIKRKGKYLIFELNDVYLISHLRMEGKFFKYQDNNINKHDLIVFRFDDFYLRYNDTRRFGRMYIFDKSIDIDSIKPLSNVGLEPFSSDMSIGYLKEKFNRSFKPIKTTLLDQTIIAGLGNIYVDEVLFLCKIHPEEKTCDLNDNDLLNIISNSCKVLEKAIEEGGTTIRSYRSAIDISGRFQNELLVHTKDICPTCARKIEKIRVGGRGTYFCPSCQRIKASNASK